MSEKLSGEEVSKRALDILQSSDFTKTLESFNVKCIKPTMNIMAKKIVKAKKKLKKLQKRQRKQDKQGVSNTADQWPSDTLDKFLAGQNEPYVINMIKHAKITEEMMDVVRERYGITKDSIINAPIITEHLDVSNRPIVCDVNMKPEIIKCQHLLVGSKFLENGDIMRKCLGCGIDMRSITIDGVFDALGKPCVIKPV